MKKNNSRIIKSPRRLAGKSSLSKEEIRKLFSPEATKKVIELCEQMISNKQTREQTIAFIKAVDGKKIRNTSGV